jgi:hypothetical protein
VSCWTPGDAVVVHVRGAERRLRVPRAAVRRRARPGGRQVVLLEARAAEALPGGAGNRLVWYPSGRAQ